MGLFDRFKNKEKGMEATTNNSKSDSESKSKEEILKKILEQQAQRSPSDYFVSGAVFDISRQARDAFLGVILSNDAIALKQLFLESYILFLQHPEYVGFTSQMITPNDNDTDPDEWNTDIVDLSNGTYVALLFMPVQSSSIFARIVGIIFGDNGDGYYYCMLNSDENVSSSVYRNKAMLGIRNIGEVEGRGFELMNSFLDCIKSEYFNS